MEVLIIEKYYVYRFLDEFGNVVYVGKTNNLRRRFANHEHLSEKVNRIEYIECKSSGESDWKEPYYINMFYSRFMENTEFINKDSHAVTDLGLNDKWREYKPYKNGVILDDLKDNIPIEEVKIFYEDFVKKRNPLFDPQLIHIFDQINKGLFCKDKFSITQNWFTENQTDNIIQLKNNISNFFKNRMPNSANELSYLKSWTTFENCKHLIKNKGYTKRFTTMWGNILSRTNAIYLVYAANNFLPVGFNNSNISNDQYALSILLNFIGRSAIRNGKEIWIYLPSFRMRRLLEQWIDENTTSPKEK